jgi:hypothetical protein
LLSFSKTSLTMPLFIKAPIPSSALSGHAYVCPYDFSIRFFSYPEGVVFLLFVLMYHFWIILYNRSTEEIGSWLRITVRTRRTYKTGTNTKIKQVKTVHLLVLILNFIFPFMLILTLHCVCNWLLHLRYSTSVV